MSEFKMENSGEKSPEGAEKILEMIDQLSEAQQQSIYKELSNKRAQKAEEFSKKIKSDIPGVVDFFTTQQNSAEFRGFCHNADTYPTRAEFINFINKTGPIYEHCQGIRQHYPIIDSILKEIE